MTNASSPDRDYRVDAEVVDICRDLIRIDTSNYGPQPGPGERAAAEHVAGLLDEVGIESELFESEPGRTTLVASWAPEGVDPDASPLLVHGHLDVVPANADDWSVPPFAGEIADGCLWGRGAVDMKDFDAMVLSVVRARVGTYEWPHRITDAQRAFLEAVSDAFEVELDPDQAEETLARLGSISRMVGATMSNTANPTMLTAGYKHNVIPGQARAAIDGRIVPGGEDEFFHTIKELIGEKVRYEIVSSQPTVETEFSGALVEAMKSCLLAEDPGARAVPFLMSGGTDAKAWDRLGIRCFGFAPLRLPPELDFVGMFHGVDERVPTASLEFGARVLDRFLDTA